MHVMLIPELQEYENISLRYKGTKRYEKIEKERHGISQNIISNLQG